MKISRRDFNVTVASIAGALLLPFERGARGQATQPAVAIGAPGEMKVKYFGAFAELPFGSVMPRGWIKGWLERQLAGMTGHPETLGFPFNTCMYAGKVPPPTVPHGANWWPYEQSGYFVDGAVRLSLLLSDPAAAVVPAANISYIVAHAGTRNIGESTWGWPNTVIGRALMAEYGGTGKAEVGKVLYDYVTNMRPAGGRDGYGFEEALYMYGLTGDARLVDFAKQEFDRLYVADAKSFSNVTKINGNGPLREHGVTAAEQLKLLPLLYSYTGDVKYLDLAKTAYRKVEGDSLMPDGGIVSQESMATTAFNSMHETCDIVDWSWSVGYLLMAGGEGHWGDFIERTTFNALPGAVTKDFKQLQYFSSANQVLASSTACSHIAMTRMAYRAAHDTECCTGNVNRGMPNYVSRMWMRTEDGLAAALYGPCEVQTKVNGQAVGIVAETDYPFRDTMTFKVKLGAPATFALHFRIPEWCAKAMLSVNGKEMPGGAAGAFATVKREFADGDVIALKLPMEVELKDWFGGKGVSVVRGPLTYSLKIAEKRVESKTEPQAITRVLKGNLVKDFPAVEFFPEGQWRYGMDAGMKKNLGQIKVIESPVGENPFVAETVPVRLEMPLRALPGWLTDWKAEMVPPPADLKQSPQNPVGLPAAGDMASAGAAETMTLLPYGATHLRVTTLPVIPA